MKKGLSVIEIKELLQKAKDKDKEARKKLIVGNIGFAKSLSLRYRYKRLQNIDELTSAALLGLIGGVDYLISHKDFDNPKGVIANFVRVAMRDFIGHDRLIPVSRTTLRKLIKSGEYPSKKAIIMPKWIDGPQDANDLNSEQTIHDGDVKNLPSKISEQEFNRQIEDFMVDAHCHYKYILRMVLAGYKDYEIGEKFCYSQRFIGVIRKKEGERIRQHLKNKGTTHG